MCATAVGADRVVRALVSRVKVVRLTSITSKCYWRRGTGGLCAVSLLVDIYTGLECLIDGVAAICEDPDHISGSGGILDANSSFDVEAFRLEFCQNFVVCK